MDYGQTIKRAIQITWRYKFLWIFGIIMALCGQGSGGTPRFQMNYSTPFDPTTGFPEFPAFFPEPLGQTPIAVYIIAGLVLLIVFGLISILVGAMGRSILIKAVARVEEDESITLGSSWRDGLNKVVPVGILQTLLAIPWLALWLVAAAIVFTTFWPFFSQIFSYRPGPESQEPPPFLEDFFTFFPMFFATICGMICFFWIIQMITGLFRTFGSRAIVLEDQGILGAFSRTWVLFRKNIGATIILALLIFVIVVVVAMIVAMPTMVMMVPIMFSTMPQIMSGGGLSTGSMLLMGCAGIITVILFSVVNGILQVFIESLWTLAYREFSTKPENLSKAIPNEA